MKNNAQQIPGLGVQSTGYTDVISGNLARQQIFEGISKAAAAVGCTMGPSGKTVLIQNDGDLAPIVTKDGVTVSKAIRLKDRLQRMGADLVREAASRTNDVAGDGTTTSTVLTHALVAEGMKLMNSGFALPELRSGVELGLATICEELQRISVKVPLTTRDALVQVASISANNDLELGNIVADAIIASGVDGIVSVEDAKGTITSMSHVKGVQIDRGYLSPYFINVQEKMCVDYEGAYILITDKKVSSLSEIIPILEAVLQRQRPLLIIADEVEGDAIQGLVLNRLKSNAPFVAIKAPGYGVERNALLDDLCTITGATKVSSSTGLSLKDVTLEQLGTVKRLIVDSRSTTFVSHETRTPQVEERISLLREQLTGIVDADEAGVLSRRIAKLAGGVAVVRVGGATEVEMIERKYRIEDALNATRAAVSDGIVPGGGAALLHSSGAALDDLLSRTQSFDMQQGIKLLRTACRSPLYWIVKNADLSVDVVLDRIRRDAKDARWGYNVKTDTVCDMLSAGIIDPVHVTRTALQNAVSVALTFLSLDAAITSEEA